MAGTMVKHDRPVDEIEITPAMIKAGEAVLDSAFEEAGLPASWCVSSALKDIYSSMHGARPVPASRRAMAAQDGDR